MKNGTFDSQPAFVIEDDGVYYYFGDRWGGKNEDYFLSTYVVLPIRFRGDKPYIEYQSEL